MKQYIRIFSCSRTIWKSLDPAQCINMFLIKQVLLLHENLIMMPKLMLRNYFFYQNKINIVVYYYYYYLCPGLVLCFKNWRTSMKGVSPFPCFWRIFLKEIHKYSLASITLWMKQAYINYYENMLQSEILRRMMELTNRKVCHSQLSEVLKILHK